MLNNNRPVRLFWIVILACILLAVPLYAQKPSGKNPVIIIPGILGSELKNSNTNKTVWFDISRAKDDDLRLPISPNLQENRDKLIPGDIIRSVKIRFLPEMDYYTGIIGGLKTLGGYEEASWDNPPENIEDKFFVFPYDWRRDNVETAQILIRRIEALKRRLNRPNLKFDILAHSMGGLISRYAAMYGDQDLPDGNDKPQLNWAGEKHIDRIFMFGTPNDGAFSAMRTLLRGPDIFGATNLPFVQNLTPADVVTMPSLFELLPHPENARFLNEDLEQFKIDIFEPDIWRDYGWSVYGDKNFRKDLSLAEAQQFEEYFEVVLDRARKFQQALDAKNSKKIPIEFFAIGSDCEDTLNTFVVYKDTAANKWETLTKPKAFTNSEGERFSLETVTQKMMAKGDGRVTRDSLLAELPLGDKRQGTKKSNVPHNRTLFVCEDHDQLPNNRLIQSTVLKILTDGN